MEEPEVEEPIVHHDTTPNTILCDDLYDGCMLKNPFDNSNCSKCNRILKASEPNREGKILYLGQDIYFVRKSDGIPEPGTVVDIKDDNGDTKIVCKYKNTFTDSQYDETHGVNTVFLTMDALTQSKGSRKRKDIDKYLPPPLSQKSSKKIKTNHNVKIEKSKSSSSSNLKLVKEKLPQASKPSSPLSSNVSSPSNTSVEKCIDESKPKKVTKSAKTAVKSGTKKLAKVSHALVCDGMELDLDDEFCAQKLEVVAQICDLNPSKDIEVEFHGRYLDKYLKRGIMHVLWNWAVPDRRQEEVDALGDYAWKPAVSIAEMQEIVKYCPVSAEQMNKMKCRRLLNLWQSQLPQSSSSSLSSSSSTSSSSSSSSSSSPTNDPLSVGEEIVDRIKKYLIQRCRYDKKLEKSGVPARFLEQLIDDTELEKIDYEISIEELKKMSLALPLPYYYFRAVMNHVYKNDIFGGSKAALENNGEIKGRKDVKNEQGEVCEAMYGSMTETFTEDTIIQHTRLGKSNTFVDIGSGIGQINIQVAATTLADSIGIELETSRYDCSILLLNEFDKVLYSIGIESGISAKVKFYCGDFLDAMNSRKLLVGDIIFFDNYGPWFGGSMATKFCDAIVQNTKDNTQIITVNQLIEAHTYCITEDLESGTNACSWMPSEKLKLFRYVKSGNVWTCRGCTFQNELYDTHCIQCNTVNRSKRTGNHNKLSRA